MRGDKTRISYKAAARILEKEGCSAEEIEKIVKRTYLHYSRPKLMKDHEAPVSITGQFLDEFNSMAAKKLHQGQKVEWHSTCCRNIRRH
jgi:hypothetical protein